VVINPFLINASPDQFCSNWETNKPHFAKHCICFCGKQVSASNGGNCLVIQVQKFNNDEELKEEDIVSTSFDLSFEMTNDDFTKLELYQMIVDGGKPWVR